MTAALHARTTVTYSRSPRTLDRASLEPPAGSHTHCAKAHDVCHSWIINAREPRPSLPGHFAAGGRQLGSPLVHW